MQAAALGPGLAAADLAGEPPPAERAPDECADALIETERHQFPFVIAADQRIIDLVGDVARISVAVGGGEGFHQLPAGKIGNADIAQLARAHERVEGRQHLFDGRSGIEGVQLQQVDIVGSEPFQRLFHTADQARARRACGVRSFADRKRQLRRQNDVVAPALDRGAKNLFRSAVGIDVCRVEKIDARLQANVDEAARLGRIRTAPGAEERPFAAEGARSEAEDRYFQSRGTKPSIFHSCNSTRAHESVT